MWELEIQNFNFKVINAQVFIPGEIKKKKICIGVQEHKPHKLILICFARAAQLIKQQQEQRIEDIKASEKSLGHWVWISPYHCSVSLCPQSPRGATESPEPADRGRFSLAECEENSDTKPAWDGSHKLRGTDSPPNPTQTPLLTPCPPWILPEDNAKGRAGESQAQLQFNSTKADGDRSPVNFARAHKGWFHPLPSATPDPTQGKPSPERARIVPFQRNPESQRSETLQGKGHCFNVAFGKFLSANSEVTTGVQFGRDEETNVSKHTECCKAQTEGWPNFNLNSPFEENFQSIRQYEL